MSKSTFKNDMEMRSFPSMDLPKGMTSPGKFGEGKRVAKRVSHETLASKASKYHPEDTGNLK
jgi:hypothetical protein|tara:strand:- start:17 stop:202 length:186 start_codon:yes stop_codon:yes gene_type:complete